jgi:hypothetical protein
MHGWGEVGFWQRKGFAQVPFLSFPFATHKVYHAAHPLKPEKGSVMSGKLDG